MSNELVQHPNGGAVATQHWSLDAEKVRVVKDVVAQGTTDVELAFFIEVCRRTGLDPFSRQIYCTKRGADDDEGKKLTIQTGIDGFRALAERTGKYDGQLGPFWCGPDGAWREAWLDDEYPPNAARVGVRRKDWREPVWAIAHYVEYVQLNRFKKPARMWEKMPANQLAKCAEALALRKAFPQDISGLYTHDEMGQADYDGGESRRHRPQSPHAPPHAAPHASPHAVQQAAPHAEPLAAVESSDVETLFVRCKRPDKETGKLQWDKYAFASVAGDLKKDIVELCGTDGPYYDTLAAFHLEHCGPDELKGRKPVELCALVKALYMRCESIRAIVATDSPADEMEAPRP